LIFNRYELKIQKHGKEATLNAEPKIIVYRTEKNETEHNMNPLTIIYWTRLLLGVAAAVLSALLTNFAPDFNLLNGISIALLVYIVSYYVYKAAFVAKVEKQSKIFTTGVGAYFLSWLVMWVLFYTLLNPVSPAP
jgi:uncharacterized membrane-anchored protein